MNKKYLVIAGYVTSKTDGDKHYIGGSDLIKLYNVDYGDCIIVNPRESLDDYPDGLIALRPLYHGGYDTYLKDK